MGDSSFDINFSALPPDLRMKLWVLALDASTSNVTIGYRHGAFTTSLAYNYGGNAVANLSIRGLSANLGVNPSSGQVDGGLVFRGFRFGTSANYVKKSAGFNFGYGASLLPFPQELSKDFNAAAGGLRSMAGDIAAAPNNPLNWYKLHSNDVDTVTRAAGTAQQIAGAGKSRFGAGLGLTVTPQGGLTITGGAIFVF